MKLRIFAVLVLCALLAGCAASTAQQPAAEPVHTETQGAETAVPETEAPAQTETPATVIKPLPDTTLETLEDAILSVSVEQGDFYQDVSGKNYLRVQIYSYDIYDMVDIAGLAEGCTIRISGKEYEVFDVQTNDHGTILINGGVDEDGFDLVTDDSGIYYLQGFSDMKYWNLICETEYLVSDAFVFTDYADLDVGEVRYTAEDLLAGFPGAEFGYGPHNTRIRVENGQAVSMERSYTP